MAMAEKTPSDLENGAAREAPKEPKIDDQSSRLPFSKLMVVFAGLQIALFTSFVDQTSVSTVTPVLADALGAGTSISWVGTSFLVATTSFQIIYGRMSDIFGRKQVMLCALGLFLLGNLLCGFAKSATELFVFRGIAGAGGGGINSLAMIIISDVVSLKERGKYQGLIGCAVAIGSAVGPLVGGALASSSSWRWVFWFTCPITFASCLQIGFTLPLTKVSGNYMEKLKKIDFGGCILSLAAVILILVPISGGGSTYAWNSALVIAMLTVGCVLAVVFVLYEWKVAVLPILPIRLFKKRMVVLLFIQTFLTGIVYYGNLYFLPLYYQNVLGMSATMSGVFILPLVLIQTLSSTLCGQITSRTGLLMPQIAFGFCLWTVGAGIQSTYNVHTSHGRIVGFLILQGIGVGCTLQTTMVALQCSVSKEDRAVVTGTRNFSRTMGGAIGLTISGAILDNVLKSKLKAFSDLDASLQANILANGLTRLSGSLSAHQVLQLREAYMESVYYVFVMFIPVVGLAAACCLFEKNVRAYGDKKGPVEAKQVRTTDKKMLQNEGSPPEDT